MAPSAMIVLAAMLVCAPSIGAANASHDDDDTSLLQLPKQAVVRKPQTPVLNQQATEEGEADEEETLGEEEVEADEGDDESQDRDVHECLAPPSVPPGAHLNATGTRNASIHALEGASKEKALNYLRTVTFRAPTETEQEELLVAHNTRRCQHGAAPLAWSEPVAADAEAYTGPLTQMAHSDCYSVPPPAGPAGENIYWTSASAQGANAVEAWYSEVNNCIPSPEAFTDGCRQGNGVTGHFTAMIWTGVRELGCAFSNDGHIVLCRYKANDQLDNDTPNMNGGSGNYIPHVLPLSRSASECDDLNDAEAQMGGSSPSGGKGRGGKGRGGAAPAAPAITRDDCLAACTARNAEERGCCEYTGARCSFYAGGYVSGTVYGSEAANGLWSDDFHGWNADRACAQDPAPEPVGERYVNGEWTPHEAAPTPVPTPAPPPPTPPSGGCPGCGGGCPYCRRRRSGGGCPYCRRRGGCGGGGCGGCPYR